MGGSWGIKCRLMNLTIMPTHLILVPYHPFYLVSFLTNIISRWVWAQSHSILVDIDFRAGSIGKTPAKLLDEGAKVLLVDLDEEALKKAVEELGGKDVKYCVTNAAKSADFQRNVTKVVDAFGKIGIFSDVGLKE